MASYIWKLVLAAHLQTFSYSWGDWSRLLYAEVSGSERDQTPMHKCFLNQTMPCVLLSHEPKQVTWPCSCLKGGANKHTPSLEGRSRKVTLHRTSTKEEEEFVTINNLPQISSNLFLMVLQLLKVPLEFIPGTSRSQGNLLEANKEIKWAKIWDQDFVCGFEPVSYSFHTCTHHITFCLKITLWIPVPAGVSPNSLVWHSKPFTIFPPWPWFIIYSKLTDLYLVNTQ